MRVVIDDDECHRQSVFDGRMNLHAVHEERAITCNHNGTAWPRERTADTRTEGISHAPMPSATT